MSFEHVNRSKSQITQSSSSTSLFAPRPFSVQEPQRILTQEDVENEAFQKNKFEVFGLQLKVKHSTITPAEQERLGVLQAKMDSFWAQRRGRTKAQSNLLEILIRNTQSAQVTEPKATTPPNAIQTKDDTKGYSQEFSAEKRSNKTGLPDNLKAGVESLSGYSLDAVRVHYNSPKPAQLHAHAFTQGAEIHVAPGQEEHLPHEAWHVVQQAQDRVKPTMFFKDELLVNDDQKLEREADVMGAKALSSKPLNRHKHHAADVQYRNEPISDSGNAKPLQMVWISSGKKLFVWHALRDGVRWFYNEETDLLFFKIEQFPKHLPENLREFYTENREKENPYEFWIKLITKKFDVEETDLVDKDDPIFEDPEFLVDEDSSAKVLLLQKISSILRLKGIKVFLGGAASGALITETRSIKDLDLRVDGLDRDIFNESKYGDFFEKNIFIPLKDAGLIVKNVEKAANTTMRMTVDGVDVSITSEPSTPRSLSRGEMVTGIESLGEFDFLLDKAAAAADRKEIRKVVTDVFDIIKVRSSMLGGGKGTLFALKSLRPRSNPGKLAMTLQQMSSAAGGRKYNNDIPNAVDELCELLKIEKKALQAILKPIIDELKNQKEFEVI